MAVKSMAYDHPAYTSRDIVQLAANTAGSGTLSGKFYCFTNTIVFGIGMNVTTAGTSTYTVGGTATNPATQVSLIRITNTSTTTVALATSTFGPFTIGGGTANAAGGYASVAVNTATTGGVACNPGDVVYVVNGTDASFVGVALLDVGIAPLANVTA